MEVSLPDKRTSATGTDRFVDGGRSLVIAEARLQARVLSKQGFRRVEDAVVVDDDCVESLAVALKADSAGVEHAVEAFGPGFVDVRLVANVGEAALGQFIDLRCVRLDGGLGLIVSRPVDKRSDNEHNEADGRYRVDPGALLGALRRSDVALDGGGGHGRLLSVYVA